ncbi:Poly-beta-1,6-N-acetyl-D-glucosamine N-deacetylase precursor [Caloramator mitchellensis]|uniref:Poly-beta-1,6-N-acetyl-D-glucosamine N-deacetylase n=1 Tax=Caloramator mitchellensis TaxID=908809 RepID=A0A0R3K213_CALMK|nr:polysaccharide deacetylase family protein [Caloramator mitchellensis]KRQ87444.1 Poly-beta-1,6-N-acetyl-D-glucosamine N-deacetylase precursor [Caloramator mitchellensis]
MSKSKCLVIFFIILLLFSSNLNCVNAKSEKIYYRNKIIVLTYHNVSPQKLTRLTITPERFESDIMLLREKGFNFVSLRQTIDAINGKGKIPANAVLITFDDGLKGFYKHAMPIIKKYRIPTVNFVITSRIKNNATKDSISMNTEEIKDVISTGLVEIQSHTHASHDYIYINENLDKRSKLAYRAYDPVKKTIERQNDFENRIYNDLVESRKILKDEFGIESDTLCFPFGHYNKKVIDEAKKAGFKYFVTTERAANVLASKSNKLYRLPAGYSDLSSKEVLNEILKYGSLK